MSTHMEGADSLCPHRPQCPGCTLFELTYPQQLAWKAETLRRELAAYPALQDVEVRPCLGADERFGWRTRVKWAVDGARIGLFGPGHRVVDLPRCPVVRPVALRVAEVLRGRPREGGKARLVALDLRVTAQGKAAATLVVQAGSRGAAEEHAVRLARWLQAAGLAELAGIAWSWRPPRAATTLGQPPRHLWGVTTLEDRIGLVATLFPAGTFSQAHAGQTMLLHRLLRDAVAAHAEHARARLLDLYAGTGGIGLALADLVAEVELVETSPAATGAVRQAAAEQGLRLRVLAGPVEQALEELRTGSGAGPLLVTVDPPRRGLAPALLARLCLARPELLAYVSCAPATLARDLAVLASHGLRCDTAQPLDMMPGTSQVETLALLRPGSPAPLRRLGQGPGWLLLERPGHLPLRPRPEWPCSVQGLAASAGYGPPAGDPPGPASLSRASLATGQDDHSGLTLLATCATSASPGPSGEVLGGVRILYKVAVRGVTRPAGIIERSSGRGAAPGEPARTRYRRLAVAGRHSLLAVEQTRGDSLQLRRNLALAGHPVLGDQELGDEATNRHLSARHGLTRPFLHADGLIGPDDAVWSAPLAPDLVAVWRSLGETGQGRLEDGTDGTDDG